MPSHPGKPPKSGKQCTDWLEKIMHDAEVAERGLLNYLNQKHGKRLDKLTFSTIESLAMDELDARFAERALPGIKTSDLEMFKGIH